MRIQDSLRRQTTRFTRGFNRAAAPQKIHLRPRSFPGRICALLRRGNEGQSVVEFALIMPLLATVLFGMYSLTMALYNYQQLSYAAFTAAQQAGAGRGLLSDPCATVASTITAALPTWTTTKFTYAVTITNSTGTATLYGPTTGSSFSCTAGAAVMAQNEPLTVGVSYQYSWIPAYLLKLSGNLSTTETVLVD
ncbi:MAG: TadE/TadG family type IV pilus assembly protein [Terracidiphilus sp.]|nr:TadE/TadG family type IV pilus assembly protein [Terracidiphilus sp.]